MLQVPGSLGVGVGLVAESWGISVGTIGGEEGAVVKASGVLMGSPTSVSCMDGTGGDREKRRGHGETREHNK